MQVNDIHAVVTISGLSSIRLSLDTTLEIEHGFVFVEAKELLFSNAVQHILKGVDEACD
jgi:hypothetical protein